jgi:hypothetical protein
VFRPTPFRLAHPELIALSGICLLAGCDLDPAGGSLSKASWEIGNTYTLEQPRRVYACEQIALNIDELGSCPRRQSGSFTVDNALMVIEPRIVYVHLVFDDGNSGWMVYNDFRMQQFSAPAKTRLIAKVGMSSDAIRSNWGEPTAIAPRPWHDLVLQDWTYAFATLSFKDGKLFEMKLSRSLSTAAG